MNETLLIKPEWTGSHKIAAQTMGMLFPYLGEERIAQWNQTNTYTGIMLDVAIFHWLAGDVDKSRRALAIAEPNKAREQAVESLCAAKADDIQMKAFNDIKSRFMSTVVEVEKSQPEIESNAEGPSQADPM